VEAVASRAVGNERARARLRAGVGAVAVAGAVSVWVRRRLAQDRWVVLPQVEAPGLRRRGRPRDLRARGGREAAVTVHGGCRGLRSGAHRAGTGGGRGPGEDSRPWDNHGSRRRATCVGRARGSRAHARGSRSEATCARGKRVHKRAATGWVARGGDMKHKQ